MVEMMVLQMKMVVGKAGEREESLNLVQMMGGRMEVRTLKDELKACWMVELIPMEDWKATSSVVLLLLGPHLVEWMVL